MLCEQPVYSAAMLCKRFWPPRNILIAYSSQFQVAMLLEEYCNSGDLTTLFSGAAKRR